jgi:hypothetical protein
MRAEINRQWDDLEGRTIQATAETDLRNMITVIGVIWVFIELVYS